jgi:ABC-type lipoprotein export system ATPase subunit
MQISDLAEWVQRLAEPSVAPLLEALQGTLESFVEIGLGYLSLDRPSGTLSGGEAQRTKMIRQLGSSLTDVTYVFDEPTIGLHPHDIERMNSLLLRLRDKGNTVLVVEHKPETIAIADHAVDLGPGAGAAGGAICFEGSVKGLWASDTTTGRHLDDRAQLKAETRKPTGVLEIRGADRNNLRDIDVDVPLGVLAVLTGVAGSGKSSLIQGSVLGRDEVVPVDQTAIKGSRRSNPATYTGLLDPIRKAFAKANGVKPALFSANSEGACPNRNGAGVIYSDLAMMAGVATTCEVCEGRRFQAEVLKYTLGSKDISEVLAMSVAEAEDFFGDGMASSPQPIRSSTGSPTSGSATSPSAGRSPRCPAASGSGSSWPPGWARRATPTFSTSRRPDSTSPTSRTCSACSTGSSTPASRSSSSSTTRRSWRTPTGSSTSAPAPATTAAGSSSRGHPPTSSPTAPPSPASTSRPTSAPDPGPSRAGLVRPAQRARRSTARPGPRAARPPRTRFPHLTRRGRAPRAPPCRR